MNKTCTRVFFKFLLVFCLLSIFTASYAQENSRITITRSGVTIKEALREVERQTQLAVNYNESKLDDSKRIDLAVVNEPLDRVMNAILGGTGFGYQLRNDYIIIVPERPDAPQETATVTGRIVGEDGLPLVGVAVTVQGTTTGTATNQNGNFTIAASPGQVINVSYLGYKPQSINVTGQKVYNITMDTDHQDIDVVVITAMGIRRAQKALSYNVQEIGADEITRVKDANFINSLSGKVAGVTINSSSSGIGGATKVVMRGVKNIEQSSNALYVIDGIPMYNMEGSGSTEFGSIGATEAIADLNPEDIETMSVLTGASAAALYGSHGANGAVIITTKKGQADRLQLTVSSTAELHNAFVLPSFQNKYGTGLNGTPEGSNSASWGELLVDKYNKKYSPRQDFLQTGNIFTNSVSLSTGTEKSQFYVSAAAVNSEGIVPNNFYERYNFTFRNTTKFLKDRMTMDVSGSYIIQQDQNMVNQGVYGNPIVSAYLFPRGDDFDQAKIFERYDASRKVMLQYWPQGAGDYYMQNPYWVAYRNLRVSNKQRYMLSANLTYDITDWLNVLGRIKIDNYTNDFEEKMYASTLATIAQSEKGNYGKNRTLNKQTYADALVNINKTFNDFSLFANVGASFSRMKSDVMTIGGPLEKISNVFQTYNINREMVSYKQGGWAEETQSVFASVEAGYKGTYYLTVTGRNDWASQLANSSNSSFFYPSVGLSILLSEIWNMPKAVNFLKVRGSFSSVGTPYPRGLTSLRYVYSDDQSNWDQKTHFPIYDLLPERTDSWEVGLTARLWNNVNFDLSFYTARTYNQTFDPQVSVSSKYSKIYMQTGNVRNQGIELTAGYNNNWNGLHWNSNVVFSANKNKILELVNNRLHPETGEYITKEWLNVGGLGRASFILKTGGTLGDLYSTTDLKTDSRGYIYVSPDGEVQLDPDTKEIKLGSVFPKSNLSWRNDFSWKNINLGFMFSARFGGIVYSATQAALDATGTSKATALARDNGGVLVNGTDRISAQNWYTTIGSQSGLPQYYVYSATNVRLQEASIGYTIPREKLGNVMDITFSVVGRNLWMIYCKAPYDPESVATTGNYYQGIDSFMVPTTRSIGFNVRLKF